MSSGIFTGSQLDFLADIGENVEKNFEFDTKELDDFKKFEFESFHNNQIEACKDIIKKYEKTRMSLLLAQMQSGKTGTFLFTACSMFHYGMVEKVMIFTGVPDKDLYEQLKISIMTGIQEYERKIEYEDSLMNHIIHLKASELTKTRIPDNTLVIWDESHYAQDTKNRPFTLFQNSGLLVNGTNKNNELWKKKDCYLLTVSATPFSEYVDATEEIMNSEIKKEIVTLRPGEKYVGVKYYKENNNVHPSWNITKSDSEQRQFVDLLRKKKVEGKPQYGIIRFRDSNSIRLLGEYSGWKVVFYDQKNKSEMLNWSKLEKRPIMDTLIVLKNMGRLGQVIPKKYVSFVFEYSSTAGSDTVLQSLLGRMCGYGPFNEEGTDIYISSHFFDEDYSDIVYENERVFRTKYESKVEEQLEEISSLGDDEFAKEIRQTEHKNDLDKMVEDHKRTVELIKATELERYINLMENGIVDIPRNARNLNRTTVNKSEAGFYGYSTTPFVIKLPQDGEWNALKDFAEKTRNGNIIHLNEDKRETILMDLKKKVEEDVTAFNDKKQRREILHYLSNKKETQERIVFTNIGQESNIKTCLPINMKKSLINNKPYYNLSEKTKYRTKKICLQLNVCNPPNKVNLEEGSVRPFTETREIYLCGVTVDAEEHTIEKHTKNIIPTTTRKEVFHESHELNDEVIYTRKEIIQTNQDFNDLVKTEFPEDSRLRIVITNCCGKEVHKYLERLCNIQNKKFVIMKMIGRPSLDELKVNCMYRYKVYFHERSRLEC